MPNMLQTSQFSTHFAHNITESKFSSLRTIVSLGIEKSVFLSNERDQNLIGIFSKSSIAWTYKTLKLKLKVAPSSAVRGLVQISCFVIAE